MSYNCKRCGKDVGTADKLYPITYPNANNDEVTKNICKECHETIRKAIITLMEDGGKN